MAEKVKKFGSVGSWKKFNEKPDHSIVKQVNDGSCVAAVGEMLARYYGLEINQKEILENIGDWSNAEDLAKFFNSKESRNKIEWEGGGWDIDKPIGVLKWLLQNYKIGAMLRQGSPAGHAVLVEGLDENELILIKDPFDQTSYRMEIEDFLKVFSEFIWRKKR